MLTGLSGTRGCLKQGSLFCLKYKTAFMKILYIFPHPDDESFGPAAAISAQKKHGHEVYLLTLTKGGATKQRFKYNYSIEEMGEVRYREMQEVAKVLELDDMTILDLPDSGLKEMDPRKIEMVVAGHILKIQPDIVVTYPVHGISGFHDHLVTHAIVKRVFLELEEKHPFLKRLAFFTISEKRAKNNSGIHRLNFSTEKEIDCVMKLDEEDAKKLQAALACYITYQETIAQSIGKMPQPEYAYFEIFGEFHEPPLHDLCVGL